MLNDEDQPADAIDAEADVEGQANQPADEAVEQE
jgi:hypothetical protein